MSAPFIAPGRDDTYRVGRAKDAGGTVYFSIPGVAITDIAGSQLATAINTDYYSPFHVASPLVIDQVATYVAVGDSGKNFRMGCYRADADWQPIGAPLFDSGDISTTATGTKTYTPGTPVYLMRGRYLSVLACNSSSVAAFYVTKGSVPGSVVATTYVSGHIRRLQNARTYAAFPTPGETWETASSTGATPPEHYFAYRVSAP